MPPEKELEGQYIESNSLNPVTQREDSNDANRSEEDDDEPKQPAPDDEKSKAKSLAVDKCTVKLQNLAVRQRTTMLKWFNS